MIKRPGAPTDLAFRIWVQPTRGVGGLGTQLDLRHVLSFEEPGVYTLEVGSVDMSLQRDHDPRQFITHNSAFIIRPLLAFAFSKSDITGAEIITTVAGTGTAGFAWDGGPATGAQLDRPFGVAVDASGNLFIADQNNDRIRKVVLATSSSARGRPRMSPFGSVSLRARGCRG